MSDVVKSTELVAAALWNLGLTSLGFIRAYIALAGTLMALVLLASIFLRYFLSCLLANLMFLRNLESTPFRDSELCDQGFLMPFLCHVWDLLFMVWFLNLAMCAPKPRSTWNPKS